MFYCFNLRMIPCTRCSIGLLTCVVVTFVWHRVLVCALSSLCLLYCSNTPVLYLLRMDLLNQPCKTTDGCCAASCTSFNVISTYLNCSLFFFSRSSFNRFLSARTHLFICENHYICYVHMIRVYLAGCPPTSTCFVSGRSVSF